MAKVSKNAGSLRRSMVLTFLITICVIGAASGGTILLANQLQQNILEDSYLKVISSAYEVENTKEHTYSIAMTGKEDMQNGLSESENRIYKGCYVIMILMPLLYLILGIGIAAAIYYRWKLKAPILQLQKGMEKIQKNDLDFELAYEEKDELGQLCHTMEKMKKELAQNNQVMWETLKQRKLLNASVAHDLRTPITVLKGYLYYLNKNIPEEKITKENLLTTLEAMQEAVRRLELYTESVHDIENLDDIEIAPTPQNMELLVEELESNLRQLSKKVHLKKRIEKNEICLDKAIFFRIIENLIQNALRYAREEIDVEIQQADNRLKVIVQDDGAGFSDMDLAKAADLFYGSEKENDHFGIGLSICKLLCEKQGGYLSIRNGEQGGACVEVCIKIN